MTWRRLREWHEDEWLIARLTSVGGQALLLLAVGLLLPARNRIEVVVAIGLSMLAPQRRMEILAVGALWVLFERLPDGVTGSGVIAIALAMTAVLALLAACSMAGKRFNDMPGLVRQFPVATLHVVLLVGLAACVFVAARGYGGPLLGAGAVALAALIPFLLWRASYLVLSAKRGTIASSRYADHLAYWFPLWGGTVTPYGKGLDHLRQHMRVDEQALARCRASGLKLLILALVWTHVGDAFTAVGSPGGFSFPVWLGGGGAVLAVPDLATAIAAGPAQMPFAMRWLTILIGLFEAVVNLAARGHVIVGVLRLFGFGVFRNTYKPLLAPTILEFWNRYYYYFKELMVEFFFYPAFVALTRQRVEIRIVLAVLAAATLGNLYYHLVMDYRSFFGSGMDAAVQHVGSRTIYCVGLGVGVAISMLRERRGRVAAGVSRTRSGGVRRLRAIAGVWFFYSVLHIWNVGRHSLDIGQRADFTLGLLGL